MATAEQVKRADRKPPARPRASWVTRKDAILINAMRPSVDNEEGRAEQMIQMLALGQHSCVRLRDNTAHCEHPDHETHMADALTALQVLGLAPYEHVRHKACTRCKQDLPSTEFSPNPRGALGVRHTCKPCQRSEAAHRREARKREAAA